VAGHLLSCSRIGGDGRGGSSRDEEDTGYNILTSEGDRTKQKGGEGRDAWGFDDRGG
jgi:hypothetical protein